MTSASLTLRTAKWSSTVSPGSSVVLDERPPSGPDSSAGVTDQRIAALVGVVGERRAGKAETEHQTGDDGERRERRTAERGVRWSTVDPDVRVGAVDRAAPTRFNTKLRVT